MDKDENKTTHLTLGRGLSILVQWINALNLKGATPLSHDIRNSRQELSKYTCFQIGKNIEKN